MNSTSLLLDDLNGIRQKWNKPVFCSVISFLHHEILDIVFQNLSEVLCALNEWLHSSILTCFISKVQTGWILTTTCLHMHMYCFLCTTSRCLNGFGQFMCIINTYHPFVQFISCFWNKKNHRLNYWLTLSLCE